MMKLFVLLATVGMLYAQASFELDDIDIQEGKTVVKEHLVLDKANGIATAHTGSHNGRKGVTEMIDSQHGIVASRFDRDDGDRMERVCAIRRLDPTVDSNPTEASHAIHLANKKMPNVVEEVKHMYIYKPFENERSLPKVIRKFCRGLKMVHQVAVTSMKEANKAALEAAKAAKKDSRKRAVVKEFTGCTNVSTMKIMTCPADKLRCDCKIRRSSCTYWIKCPMNLEKGGFDCKGLHKFNSMVCCDYNC